jgi:hopene-associated glycosyltransferase HpnB
VVVVVPAHDEAEVLPATLPALLALEYGGEWSVVLVDDRSADGTAAVAGELARRDDAARRLTIVHGEPLPPGWTGKVWALEQGVRAARGRDPAYVLLTDADNRHEPGSLARLVAEGEDAGLALNSRMALLSCRSRSERLLIPAFVFFFNLLYPMRRVNSPRSRVAAAAGGCVLLRVDALERIGGLQAIRGAIIDDVSLGRAVKSAGLAIRLATSRRDVVSVRAYPAVGNVWRMVRRTAFDELRYSWWRLGATVAGLAVAFGVPPALVPAAPALAAAGAIGWGTAAAAAGLGAAAWLAMTAAYTPAVRFFGLPAWRAASLPLAGVLYGGMTLDSAWRHLRGRPAAW